MYSKSIGKFATDPSRQINYRAHVRCVLYSNAMSRKCKVEQTTFLTRLEAVETWEQAFHYSCTTENATFKTLGRSLFSAGAISFQRLGTGQRMRP
mgnify:CR=1